MTAAAITSWPPASLAETYEQVITECEKLEVSGNDDPVTLVVEMAALLVAGDTIAARHLWRRYRENTVIASHLFPWWQVGAAMMEWNIAAIWNGIAQLSQSEKPVYRAYAQEIAQAYRQKIMNGLLTNAQTPPPTYYASVMGMNDQEFVEYWKSQATESTAQPSADVVASQTQVVAFLESRMNALSTE